MIIDRYHIFCTEFGRDEEVGRLQPELNHEEFWEVTFKPYFAKYIGYRSFIGTWPGCICTLQALFKGFLRKY